MAPCTAHFAFPMLIRKLNCKVTCHSDRAKSYCVKAVSNRSAVIFLKIIIDRERV